MICFKQSYAIQPQDSNSFVGWTSRSMGFNKNNEYFNDITDGYTLFGYQLNPYVAYRAGEHVRLDVGVYLQQDFGNDEFDYLDVTNIFYKIQRWRALYNFWNAGT